MVSPKPGVVGHFRLPDAGRLRLTVPDGRGHEINETSLIHFLRHTLLRMHPDQADDASLVCAKVVLGATLGKPLLHRLPSPWVQLLRDAPTLVGRSHAPFAATFAVGVGQATIEHMAAWRLSLMQGLLAQDRQVNDVGDVVGDGSPQAPAWAFTQRLGLTPINWLAGHAGSEARGDQERRLRGLNPAPAAPAPRQALRRYGRPRPGPPGRRPVARRRSGPPATSRSS